MNKDSLIEAHIACDLSGVNDADRFVIENKYRGKSMKISDWNKELKDDFVSFNTISLKKLNAPSIGDDADPDVTAADILIN
jgi:hypothetical protein